MMLLQYALLSLSRRWKKQVFLLLIYSVVVGFYASIVFFTTALRSETNQVLENLPQLWLQKIAGGRLQPHTLDFLDSLKNIRGVKSVIPRIWGYQFDSPTGAVFTIIGTETSLEGYMLIQTHQKTPLGNNQALVGTGFLEQRGVQIGETLTLADPTGKIHSFQIVGAFQAEADLLTKDLILLSVSSARTILGLEKNQVTDIALEIFNENETDNIARKLDRQFGGLRIVTLAQLKSTYEALFSRRGGIFLYGTILVILAFLILAWERASGLSREEKRELGILKAMGWQINEVLQVKFWEGFIISFSATLLGILWAYIHIFIFDAPLLKPFFVGWSVLYPDFQLQPIVHWSDLAMIGIFSIVPYLMATLIPAWKGAITDPSEVMNE